MLPATVRERLILLSGVVVLVSLSWVYLIGMAVDMAQMPMGAMSMDGMSMDDMSMGSMTMHMPWSAYELASLFVMWAVMMVAMMLPSALPMILTFMAVNQRRQQARRATVPTYVFTSAYIAVWTLYSAGATALQWYLHENALMSADMATQVPYLSSGILIAAGIFQFSSLKQACLKNCRTPLSFLMSEWREGHKGAFLMGLRHGGYCVGCCWSLMLVLFVTGVMNLLAVLAIATFVLVEKLIPKGKWISQLSGGALIVIGVSLITVSG